MTPSPFGYHGVRLLPHSRLTSGVVTDTIDGLLPNATQFVAEWREPSGMTHWSILGITGRLAPSATSMALASAN